MLVSQDLFRVQEPAGVSGGADGVSPYPAVNPRAPIRVDADESTAPSGEWTNWQFDPSASGDGAAMRTKWVAGYSANAMVGLLAGLGLVNWGFGAIPVSGLCAPGVCGVVAGVAITLLALACVGAATYAMARPAHLPGWWPSRSTLVLRGIGWVIGELVTGLTSIGSTAASDEGLRLGDSATVQRKAARLGIVCDTPVEPSTGRVAGRVSCRATPKYGPQGIFTKSGSPVVRAARQARQLAGVAATSTSMAR